MRKERELFVTPEVKWFLQKCAGNSHCSALSSDIAKVIAGNAGTQGFIRIGVPPYLCAVLPPLSPDGHERVVFWHGPTDGMFFRDSIWEKAVNLGFALA